MSLADDLRAAKALIDTPEKWGKGMPSFSNSYTTQPEGPICAIGACNVIAYQRSDGPRANKVYIELGEALSAVKPDGFFGVPEFNDDPATTHADIMALFDRAIQAATPEPENKS